MLGTVTRRQKLIGGVTGGVMTIAMVLALVLGGRSSVVPHQGGSVGARILLWLYAPRDMGRLPARADWCAGSSHCWLAQETAGATQLADVTGGWTLDASGTPRAGVATSLPVEDASGWVDFSSELSTHTDGQSASGTGSWWRAAQTQSATNLVSVSAVILPVYRQAQARILYSHRATADGTGFEVGLATTGKLYATVENSSGTTKTITTAATWDDGAWHAVTWVLDGRSANAGRIYVDAVEAQQATPDLVTTGSWATTGPARLGADEDGANVWPGGIARLRTRIGVDVAVTYAGTLWGFNPQAAAKVSAADIAWSQSGSPRCYQSSATAALCVAGGRPGPIWDSTITGGRSMAWAVQPNALSRANGNTQVCAAGNWTNNGAATSTCWGAVAPDGSKTASAISVGAGTGQSISKTFFYYNASTLLYPSIWVQCSSGTMRIQGSTGLWSLNCATVGGAWTRVHAAHPAVTVTTAMQSAAGGTFALYIHTASGTITGAVWLPTIPEVEQQSVMRHVSTTTTTYVETGAITWKIDNSPAVYYSGSCGRISMAGAWTSGGCLDIYSPGDAGGRQFWDGAHWSIGNSDATPVGVANLVPSGLDVLSFRWNSAAALAPLTTLAEVLRDGAAQTWDTTPLTAWTGESPTVIHVGDYDGTGCRANIQSIQIWDRP